MQVVTKNEVTITMTGREAITLGAALRYVLSKSTAQQTGFGIDTENFIKALENAK